MRVAIFISIFVVGLLLAIFSRKLGKLPFNNPWRIGRDVISPRQKSIVIGVLFMGGSLVLLLNQLFKSLR